MLLLCGNSRSLSTLPIGLQQMIHLRLMATEASTSTSGGNVPNNFPFPTHSNPTPHEIFHLKKGCPKHEIKSRYYELVRAYHPDAPHSRSIPPEIRHKRFQSISAAYDILSGKSSSNSQWGPSGGGDAMYEAELRRRKQAYYNATAARGNWDDATFSSDDYNYGYYGGSRRKWDPPTAEDVWKDRTIIWGSAFLAILTFVPFLYHSPFSTSQYQKSHLSARENYMVARSDAKIFGKERMAALKKEAQQRRLEKAERDGKLDRENVCSS